MKKIFAIILVAFFVSQAANVNQPCYSERNNIYKMNISDTLGIQTGNSATVYLDTTSATRKGIAGDALTGDSIAVMVWGYGDADSTQVQIKIDESPDAGSNYVTVKTDTLKAMTASVNSKKVITGKNPNCMYRVVETAYGTTDSSCVLGTRIWGE